MKLTDKDLSPIKDAMDPLLQNGQINRARQLSQLFHKYLDNRRKSKKSIEVDIQTLNQISKELRDIEQIQLSLDLIQATARIIRSTYLA